jgi:hypothetical protein
MHKGINIKPVPKKGTLSTKEIRNAYLIGLCKPNIEKPIEINIKVKINNLNST